MSINYYLTDGDNEEVIATALNSTIQLELSEKEYKSFSGHLVYGVDQNNDITETAVLEMAVRLSIIFIIMNGQPKNCLIGWV